MMRTPAVLLLASVALAAPAQTSAKTTAPKATKKTAATKTTAVQPVTIPADAMRNPNGSYTWTDKQGKRWIFAATPFGVMKTEVATPPSDSRVATNTKVFDEGDKVRFETPSPFGVIKREKNKADLTDEEQDLVDSQTKQPANQTPAQNAKQD